MKRDFLKIETVNEQSFFKMLKLIDENGNYLGEMSKEEALQLKKQNQKDLIVINNKVSPPIVKLILYSKYAYQKSKEEKEKKKRERQNKTIQKEIFIRPKTSKWDLARIQKKIEEWLDKDHIVKLNMSLSYPERKFIDNEKVKMSEFANSIKNARIIKNIEENSRGLTMLLGKNKS